MPVIIDIGALLALLSERDNRHDWIKQILTFDKDFIVYRQHQNQSIPLLMPNLQLFLQSITIH